MVDPSARIIVAVDDDGDDADLLRLLLRKAGLPNPLEIYREGEEIIHALSALLHESVNAMRPLLCFLDVKMPAMNGHDILRWIRGKPELDRLPVIMLSSSEHPRDVTQAAQGGAQCYLAKYPQPAVLKQVVAEASRFVQGAPAAECFQIPGNLLRTV